MSLLKAAVRAIRIMCGYEPDAGIDKPSQSSVREEKAMTPSNRISEHLSDQIHLEAFTLGTEPIEDLEDCGNVEFVGGPLDGLLARLPVSEEGLSVVIAVPVSPSRLARLSEPEMLFGHSSKRPTSVVFYELDFESYFSARYLFLGPVRPEDARGLWIE